jgi:hypothetical protein
MPSGIADSILEGRSMRFLRFIQAAGSIGLSSVGFGIVLFIIAIIEHVKDKNLPVYWLVAPAVLFAIYGAYRAWGTEHVAYEREVAKNLKPLLKIEVQGSFFDVSRIPDTQKIQVHIYAYLKVTNLTAAETTIKDGSLVMSVSGLRYKGFGDDKGVMGKSLEHISNFKIGGETTTTDVFGKNTLSPFKKLPALNSDSPLKRGITQEGFVTFTFTDSSMDWDHEQPYSLPVTDFVLAVRDSFDGTHEFQMAALQIPQAAIKADDGSHLKWKEIYKP